MWRNTLSTGFPGYDSIIGADNATVGRILSLAFSLGLSALASIGVAGAP
jgi:hypothetical protein